MIAGRAAVLLLAIVTLSEPLAGDDPTHATRGTVKTADATEIVVARPKKLGDITIEVSPSTHVDGQIRVGATVSVRYHDDHGRHIATAVTVERQVNRN